MYNNIGDIMKYITLNNKVKMPILGLGTYYLVGKKCTDIVLKAIESGYRLIDTAAWYNNEKEVGEAIKKSSVDRKELFITTKISNCDDYESAIKRIEESFNRLNLDYIDLVLVHWPEGKYIEVYKALEYYYEQGKIKAIGVSNYNKDLLDNLLKYCKIKPVIDQIETHIYWQQSSLHKYLKENNIYHEAWSQFGEGYLKVLDDPLIIELSKKYNKTPAQITLNYLVNKDIIVIPRTSNPKRLKENIDVFDFELDKKDIKEIEKLNRNQSVSGWPSYMKEQ